ncbi:hypothetical protein TNCV_4944951 [Trichonephila clavipes]|nr:hypothetical protein TNCV_4944951 [Trichonephila clavipes]
MKDTNYYREVGFGGLEVAYPLRKLKVAGTTPAGVDRFPRCENRRIIGTPLGDHTPQFEKSCVSDKFT